MPRLRNRSTSFGSPQESLGSKTNSFARFRHRSASFGSHMETIQTKKSEIDEAKTMEIAKTIFATLLKIRDPSGKSFLHQPNTNLSMAKALLDRARGLDELGINMEAKLWQRMCLLQVDKESGYTPFHSAILQGNLSEILLFLRHAMDEHATGRLALSPMTVLHNNGNIANGDLLLQEIVCAADKEGFTPLELLERLQRSELALCRKQIIFSPKIRESSQHRPRRSSFDEDGQDELDFLTENLDLLEPQEEENKEEDYSYACEVVTFGRPHHSALGVVASASHEKALLRPQRVQEFAQELLKREGSAVAVAAATHHTLVATRNGHLYAFGLGKGGRLGLGEAVQHCPLPRRLGGSLGRKKVIGVAAADNHSLCVTKDGTIFAWGSNRFGQLGTSPNSKGSNSNQGNSQFLPRRVDDLRNISCVAVAVGEKHSVALTRKGEVYVWGDNTAGQLGVPRRSGIQKVQRVEALWTSSPRKVAVALSAAEQSTLVLTNPIQGVTQVNSIYSWGHGNYVPIRVHFENSNTAVLSKSLQSRTRKVINPVAIACAKYHNVAITSDGHVYTWGLHTESLGRSNTNNKQQNSSSSGRSASSPQLVTGMLPENGGGVAVALSASDQHTAVVTECGGLYTWGSSFGNNVLGHEGVKWQPNPKRVPGVHRAIDVAVAKEHTVLLIGSSFPPQIPAEKCTSLELLAARKVADHVDLFNVIPVLIMAERTKCSFLVDYCNDFVKRNLDGVLTVGKKKEMNQYLNDMLADSSHSHDRGYRDDRHHPFVFNALLAGKHAKPSSFGWEWLSSTEEWAKGCIELSKDPIIQSLITTLSSSVLEEEGWSELLTGRPRRASSCASDCVIGLSGRNRALSCTSDQESKIKPLLDKQEEKLNECKKKTRNMDLSTPELVEENSVWLAKEIRGVRKKLNQIQKLQQAEELKNTILSIDEQAKVDRRSGLEAELDVYETALERVEKRVKELASEKKQSQLETKKENSTERCTDKFFCDICCIKCPDQTSFELHKNGRKHRNRVTLVAEEEKTKAAASIMARHQVEQVKQQEGSERRLQKTPPTLMIQQKQTAKSAWGMMSSSSSAQPTFTLPPPPHPPVPQVVSSSASSSSSPWKTSSTSGPSRLSSVARKSSFPVTPTKTPPIMKKKTGSKDALFISTAPPKAAIIPVWHSSPGSSRPSTTSTSLEGKKGQRNSYSLADFLAPKKPPDTPTTKTWSSPAAAAKKPTSVATKKKTSFAEIQAEEEDFITRQDTSYKKGGGNWFIERRERANSLLEIQTSARKEQEEREFIEEQKRIEEQIQKDLALMQQQQQKLNQKKNKGKKKKKQSSNNDNVKKPNDGKSSGGACAKGKKKDKKTLLHHTTMNAKDDNRKNVEESSTTTKAKSVDGEVMKQIEKSVKKPKNKRKSSSVNKKKKKNSTSNDQESTTCTEKIVYRASPLDDNNNDTDWLIS